MSSLDKAHSIGSFKDDLDDISLATEEQDKILFKHLDKEGPICGDQVSLPSAEYESKYDDDSQDEINTQEIKEWFPEKYQWIENCEDSLDQIKIKQMIKLDIKAQMKKEQKEEARALRNNASGHHDVVRVMHLISFLGINFERDFRVRV